MLRMRVLIMVCCLASGCAVAPRAPVTSRTPVKVLSKAPFGVSVKLRVDAWAKLSSATSGMTVESQGANDVPALITRVFDGALPQGPVDIVFVVDGTGSMHDDIDAVKSDMRRILDHLRQRNPDYRVGVVAYRDVDDAFLTRTFLFLAADDARIHRAISAIKVHGGGDWREHVYAGINTALTSQPWRPHASQHIILMGDAPPHENYRNDPRNYDSVTAKAQAPPLRVHIHTIGIKCDRSCQAALAKGE